MPNGDPYSVLGLKPSATEEEIKKAYRSLAKEWHPDKHQGSKEAEDRFKAINEAYQALTKPKTSPFKDFVNAQNNPFAGVARRAKAAINNIVNGKLAISLKDILLGKKEKEVPIKIFKHCSVCTGDGIDKAKDTVNCTHCNGKGFFQTTDQFMTMQMACPQCAGKGYQEFACQSCQGTGVSVTSDVVEVVLPKGYRNRFLLIPEKNLRIQIECILPEGVQVDNEGNVLFPLWVNYPQMIIGGSKTVLLLDEKEVKLKLPKGLKEEQPIRLAGHGLPNADGRGDLIFYVKLKMPNDSDISEEQTQALLKLQQVYEKENF